MAAAPRQKGAPNAIIDLLPRLQESWFFLSRQFLAGRRLDRLLDADGHELVAKRYHQLVVPALRTFVNVLVTHEDNQFVLEQAVEFLKNSRQFIFEVLRNGSAAGLLRPPGAPFTIGPAVV